MRRLCLLSCLAIAIPVAFAGEAPGDGPYTILKTAKAGGDGGFDYVHADAEERRLYVARSGASKRISVFNLDTLESAGEIPDVGAHGAATDAKSHHGFTSSKPVVMFDTRTLKPIKTIDVQGNPDGLLFDPFNQRLYVLSHAAPNATVIDTTNGVVLGTIDLEGAPEQAATDNKGHVYVDIEDKNTIAMVDATSMKVTAHYDLGDNKTPAGLALDQKNHILFVGCRNPAVSVVMNALNGKIITTLPIGAGVDGAGFNPRTMEAFSSQSDGTLTIIKETSPTTFEVEQNLRTMTSAKTMTIDNKTGRVFLIGAEFGPAVPPTTPTGRSGRGPLVPGSFTILQVGKE